MKTLHAHAFATTFAALASAPGCADPDASASGDEATDEVTDESNITKRTGSRRPDGTYRITSTANGVNGPVTSTEEVSFP